MRTLRTLLVVVGLVIAAAGPAAAAPPSTDHIANSQAATAWLAGQVAPDGHIDSAIGTYSATAQAVPLFAATGVGAGQIPAMLTYLGAHVDDFAAFDGDDHAAELSYLILAAVAAGQSPTAFGSPSTDLVARLEAIEQTTGTDAGLFGSQSPDFDGAFRQGLALLALDAAGVAPDAAAITWLSDQQCADGLWTAYRADTSVACPAVDPNTFSGPDTNSTALAAIGMQVSGSTTEAAAGVAALKAIRNADGAWGYLADSAQPTDANSTGVVGAALQLIDGATDPQAVAALEALQVGCDGDPLDVGGVAFQGPAPLAPDVLATVQAAPTLAGITLPVTEIAPSVAPEVCAPEPGGPPVTEATTVPATDPAPTTTIPDTGVRGNALARTGSADLPLSLVALGLMGGGIVLVAAARRRQRQM